MSNASDKDKLTPTMRRALAAAGRIGGSATTPLKSATAAANIAGQRRPLKPLSDFPCTCPAGPDTLEGHRAYCPLGRAIKRRYLTP